VSVAARFRFGALVLAFALAQLAVHARAGFTFPPPWIDEAQFLWQAKAIADMGTLLAPQLHPERPILWMPPGYFVVTGAALRGFGFDFAFARNLSLVYLLAAFGLLAGLLRRLPHAGAAVGLAGTFFLGRSFVAIGNVARMEALLLLGVLAGFALLRSGRCWQGLALLAATPLVHPNGVWFCAAGALWVGLRARSGAGLPSLRRSDVALGLAVAAAWLAFAALAAANAEAFRHDLAYQLARKAGAGELGILLDGRLLALAALLVLAHRLRREVPEAVLLACLAVPALAAHSLGQEYWYEIFEGLFYLLLSVLALEAATLWLANRPATARHPRLACAGVLGALLLANLVAHRVPNPFGYPENVVWHRMQVSDGEPYLDPADRAFVRDWLIALAPPGELPWVRFHPAAEALFYADLDGSEIRVSEPVFHEHEPDWYLLRTSRWSAGGGIERALFARAGVDRDGEAHVIHRRGLRERWYAIRASTPDPGSRLERASEARSEPKASEVREARGLPRAGTRRPASEARSEPKASEVLELGEAAVEAVDGMDGRGVAGEEPRDRSVHGLMLLELRLAGEGAPGDRDLEVSRTGRANLGASAHEIGFDRGAELLADGRGVRRGAQDLEGHGEPR